MIESEKSEQSENPYARREKLLQFQRLAIDLLDLSGKYNSDTINSATNQHRLLSFGNKLSYYLDHEPTLLRALHHALVDIGYDFILGKYLGKTSAMARRWIVFVGNNSPSGLMKDLSRLDATIKEAVIVSEMKLHDTVHYAIQKVSSFYKDNPILSSLTPGLPVVLKAADKVFSFTKEDAKSAASTVKSFLQAVWEIESQNLNSWGILPMNKLDFVAGLPDSAMLEELEIHPNADIYDIGSTIFKDDPFAQNTQHIDEFCYQESSVGIWRKIAASQPKNIDINTDFYDPLVDLSKFQVRGESNKIIISYTVKDGVQIQFEIEDPVRLFRPRLRTNERVNKRTYQLLDSDKYKDITLGIHEYNNLALKGNFEGNSNGQLIACRKKLISKVNVYLHKIEQETPTRIKKNNYKSLTRDWWEDTGYNRLSSLKQQLEKDNIIDTVLSSTPYKSLISAFEKHNSISDQYKDNKVPINELLSLNEEVLNAIKIYQQYLFEMSKESQQFSKEEWEQRTDKEFFDDLVKDIGKSINKLHALIDHSRIILAENNTENLVELLLSGNYDNSLTELVIAKTFKNIADIEDITQKKQFLTQIANNAADTNTKYIAKVQLAWIYLQEKDLKTAKQCIDEVLLNDGTNRDALKLKNLLNARRSNEIRSTTQLTQKLIELIPSIFLSDTNKRQKEIISGIIDIYSAAGDIFSFWLHEDSINELRKSLLIDPSDHGLRKTILDMRDQHNPALLTTAVAGYLLLAIGKFKDNEKIQDLGGTMVSASNAISSANIFLSMTEGSREIVGMNTLLATSALVHHILRLVLDEKMRNKIDVAFNEIMNNAPMIGFRLANSAYMIAYLSMSMEPMAYLLGEGLLKSLIPGFSTIFPVAMLAQAVYTASRINAALELHHERVEFVESVYTTEFKKFQELLEKRELTKALECVMGMNKKLIMRYSATLAKEFEHLSVHELELSRIAFGLDPYDSITTIKKISILQINEEERLALLEIVAASEQGYDAAKKAALSAVSKFPKSSPTIERYLQFELRERQYQQIAAQVADTLIDFLSRENLYASLDPYLRMTGLLSEYLRMHYDRAFNDLDKYFKVVHEGPYETRSAYDPNYPTQQLFSIESFVKNLRTNNEQTLNLIRSLLWWGKSTHQESLSLLGAAALLSVNQSPLFASVWQREFDKVSVNNLPILNVAPFIAAAALGYNSTQLHEVASVSVGLSTSAYWLTRIKENPSFALIQILSALTLYPVRFMQQFQSDLGVNNQTLLIAEDLQIRIHRNYIHQTFLTFLSYGNLALLLAWGITFTPCFRKHSETKVADKLTEITSKYDEASQTYDALAKLYGTYAADAENRWHITQAVAYIFSGFWSRADTIKYWKDQQTKMIKKARYVQTIKNEEKRKTISKQHESDAKELLKSFKKIISYPAKFVLSILFIEFLHFLYVHYKYSPHKLAELSDLFEQKNIGALRNLIDTHCVEVNYWKMSWPITFSTIGFIYNLPERDLELLRHQFQCVYAQTFLNLETAEGQFENVKLLSRFLNVPVVIDNLRESAKISLLREWYKSLTLLQFINKPYPESQFNAQLHSFILHLERQRYTEVEFDRLLLLAQAKLHFLNNVEEAQESLNKAMIATRSNSLMRLDPWIIQCKISLYRYTIALGELLKHANTNISNVLENNKPYLRTCLPGLTSFVFPDNLMVNVTLLNHKLEGFYHLFTVIAQQNNYPFEEVDFFGHQPSNSFNNFRTDEEQSVTSTASRLNFPTWIVYLSRIFNLMQNSWKFERPNVNNQVSSDNYCHTLKNQPTPFDSSQIDSDIAVHPITGESIFTLRVMDHGIEVGSALLYGDKNICVNAARDQHNVIQFSGVLKKVEPCMLSILHQIENQCSVMPPSRIELLIRSTQQSAGHGSIRGASMVLSDAMHRLGYSKKKQYYMQKISCYFSLFCFYALLTYSTLRSNDDSGAIVNLCINTLKYIIYLACIDLFTDYSTFRATKAGYGKTASLMKNVGMFAHYASRSYQQGIEITAISTIAGIIAENATKSIGFFLNKHCLPNKNKVSSNATNARLDKT